MSKVLKRKLFRHKYQTTTNQVPGYSAGAFLNTLRTLANVVTPYTQGAKMYAQPLMQRGVQFGQKVAESPAGRLAGRGIKRLGENRFVKGLGNVVAGASVPYASYSAGQTLYNLGQSGMAVGRGDFDQAKTELGEAAQSAVDTAYNIPFLRKGADLYSKGVKAIGMGEGRGARKLAQTVTPKFTKTAAGGLGFEGGVLAADVALPDYEPNLFEEKPRAHNLFPPTPEDEAKLDSTNNNVLTQTGESGETERQAVVEEGGQSAVEANASETQFLVNSENLNRVYGQASKEIQKDKKDVSISDVIKRTEDPELYDKVISGGQGGIAKEMQIIFDQDFAKANAKELENIELNSGESSLGTAATLVENQNRDMLSSAALIADYESKLDERKKKSFDEYKKTYQEMTGDDGKNNYRDLAVLKWAMRMMSGKTSQTGLAGFFDVFGRSSAALADDIMAIDQNEKANARLMAEKYMDYEKAFETTTAANEKDIFVSKLGLAQQIEERAYQDEKQAAQNAFELDKLSKELNAKAEEARVKRMRELTQADGKGRKYLIKDPNAFLGRRGTTVYFNKNKDPLIYGDYVDQDGNRRRGLIPYLDDKGLPVMVDKLREVKNNPTLQAKSLNRMKNAAEAMRYSRTVQDIVRKHGTDIIGLSGELQVLYGKLTDTLSQVPGVGPGLSRALGGTNANDYVTGRSGNEYLGFDQVNTNFSKSLGTLTLGDGLDAAEAAKTAADLEKLYGKDWERKNSEAVIRMYNDDMKLVTSEGYINKIARKFKLDPAEADFADKKRALAELLIIEQRMKYLVAHANKGGDRLAVSDILNAAERTQIFPIFGDRGLVLKNYESFGDEMRKVMNTEFERYLSNGGDESVIPLMFKDNEWVIENQANQPNPRRQVISKEDAEARLKSTGVIQ